MSESIQTAAINQLKEVNSLCRSCWTVRLETENGRWLLPATYGLNSINQEALFAFFEKPGVNTWLAGGLASGRIRWRATGALSNRLGCKQVYLFPIGRHQGGLLLGIDELDPPTKKFIKILTRHFFLPSSKNISTAWSSTIESSLKPAEGEFSYNPHNALERIVQVLAEQTSCDKAYLAVRSGNFFTVKADWKCEGYFNNRDLSIQEILPLRTIINSHRGMVLRGKALEEVRIYLTVENTLVEAWMGVPILLGQQVIGLAAFMTAQKNVFTAKRLSSVYTHTKRLAYSVENAIVFAEAGRYLQQMALLNELATTVALGMEINEVARRIMQRLRRVFNIDWAAVFLLSTDGAVLREYGGEGRRTVPLTLPVETTFVGLAVKSGMPVRDNNLVEGKHYQPTETGLHSEMAVPLKYQGKVIGAIDLMSKEINTFSSQDEQLLVLISSHLAGLLENMRLSNETQERAKKLQDTVRQLQAVRETALDISSALDLNILLTRIAHRAQILVDARGAELGLYNEKDQVVTIVVSETPWENFPGIYIPIMEGIAGKMAVSGEPIVVRDYNSWPGRLLPERQAPFRTAAGVPLKIKGQVIGTLTVMDDRDDKSFSEDDIQLLELLSPQASISIGNARLYQELQERIEAQRRAESNLIRSARLAAVGEMAAGVAHELNNPLTTVTGFVELVMDDLDNTSAQYADLDLALQEALRARGVVRRMLDFSRPAEVQHIKTDLNELVRQVLTLTRHMMNISGVSLDLELKDNLPWISADSNQIQQVLHNLISNAVQAMPSGGRLTIRTGTVEREGSNWVITEFVDTGIGIPPENLDRIFEPFFTTRVNNKGTGLGLSVSYGIVESHGGFIDVISQVGLGSCFTIFLPTQQKIEMHDVR